MKTRIALQQFMLANNITKVDVVKLGLEHGIQFYFENEIDIIYQLKQINDKIVYGQFWNSEPTIYEADDNHLMLAKTNDYEKLLGLLLIVQNICTMEL